MKIALGVRYDGSRYHGWQRQPGLLTVQEKLENALSKVADTEIKVTCAGRTDTGVHALSQVVHFETQVKRNEHNWVFGSNYYMPNNISTLWAKKIDDEFNARFSATHRRYFYVIYNHSIRPALLRDNLTWHYAKLNHKTMHQAAQPLIGEHDFTSFRSIECQSKSPFRNVQHINVTRRGNSIIIDVKANAFLHHMVRNIVGVLIAIGSGKKKPSWAKEVLYAKDRRVGGITAPPNGLYLAEVTYPKKFNIPKSKKTVPLFLD